MAPRTAIFYAEHPLALLRDFTTEREPVRSSQERSNKRSREHAMTILSRSTHTAFGRPCGCGDMCGIGDGAAQRVCLTVSRPMQNRV